MPQAFERHTISFVLRLWMNPCRSLGTSLARTA